MPVINKTSGGGRKGRDPFLEALRDLGQDTIRVAKDDLLGGIASDILPEALGMNKPQAGGELKVGEEISFEKRDREEGDAEMARRRGFFERSRREIEVVVEENKEQLALKVQAVRQEIANLAKQVMRLDEAVKEAVMVAPVDPGVYHEGFFEKLRNFLIKAGQDFKKAAVWLEGSTGRAKKKQGFWGKYKSQGSKFYLSQEHYLTRSAG